MSRVASKYRQSVSRAAGSLSPNENENSVIIYSPSSSKPVWMYLFCWTQRKIFWRMFVTRLFWATIDFHWKKNILRVNGAPELLCFPHSSEYLPLSSAEQIHSYRFGTTGWINDDRIFIFGWTVPLSLPHQTVLLKSACRGRCHHLKAKKKNAFSTLNMQI